MPEAELRLNLPWVPRIPEEFDALTVRRGRRNRLTYEDNIALDVCVVDPADQRSMEELLEEVHRQEGPGRVVLVSGSVPIEWRGRLRGAEVSFLDATGVAEIDWPRLRASARRFGKAAKRQTSPIPLQKSHAVVAQELLIVAGSHYRATVGSVAQGAAVSVSSASRAIDRLASQGLVAKSREGREVLVSVTDPVELAGYLAERTAWGRGAILWGYLWGRNSFEVANNLTARAGRVAVALAVTGRVGAAFHGVLGTASPPAVRCWVEGDGSLGDIAVELGLEEADRESANIALVMDRWGVGRHRSSAAKFDQWEANVAHPLRVWCDLHDEPRGDDFAAQLWRVVSDGW